MSLRDKLCLFLIFRDKETLKNVPGTKGHKGAYVSKIRDTGTFDRDKGQLEMSLRDKIRDIGTKRHKLKIKREMSHVPMEHFKMSRSLRSLEHFIGLRPLRGQKGIDDKDRFG